ncbi:MAG: carbonate dehydratase [Saprospiraceae bacterium]|nr:carbonate dehydratase [Saprospiraceae bacterium]MCB0626142.1 carbonate dehydratase [Saprospiraceae bacterium]MCB0678037.1 carbonate dehydratase [Saprospiraceae bacterium]MCB0683114.1 carbonate dehydratase [Saprospiraceae bacterium]
MPRSYLELIEGNREFADAIRKEDPGFFENLATGQQPKYLWIGCADSRVPPANITGVPPGSIFVHRNIANVVVHTDANLLSVAYYAVKVLKVKHIIVCGHYGCGGIQAAMSNKRYGYIDGWLRHIKDVVRFHESELKLIVDEQARLDRLVELNVVEQVGNLAKVPFIQEEWEKGEFPYIHGWVYDLKSGKIRQLDCTINNTGLIEDVFDYDL